MHRCLVGTKGPFQGSTMVLGARVGIGRGDVHGIQIVDDPLVSRDHASLGLAQDGSSTIRDDFSRNGTFVNGKKVRACRLKDGDRIDIGGSSFVFREMTDEELARQEEARILHVASGPALDLTMTGGPQGC